MHVKRQLKVAICGKQNIIFENENFTLEKCSNMDKMMQVTNFVLHVLKKEQMKGTKWTLPYITARTDTNKIQIQHTYNDLRTALLDIMNLNRVILPMTVPAPGFMHSTKIDNPNKVNLSIQERTYLPTYIYIHT